MPSLRERIRHWRERRANRRALNKEPAGRSPREGQEIGYMTVGKGNKSKERHRWHRWRLDRVAPEAG